MEPAELTQRARDIWDAGVAAVLPGQLLPRFVSRDENHLTLAGQRFSLPDFDRLIVVGAGKAGASMAAAFLECCGPEFVRERVTGWVNVPADCLREIPSIHLYPARAAGVNEPTEAGVFGTSQILELVSHATTRDVCVVLLSGGGSALLPAPVPEISLADKQQVTRFLMQAGATIRELNIVRSHLSLVKGGGLARACRAGHLVTLIVSDVIGDPLEIIASGPTVAATASAGDALSILERFQTTPGQVPASVLDFIRTKLIVGGENLNEMTTHVTNCIIGNNATALAAASATASSLGYQVQSLGSDLQGTADACGQELARLARRIQGELNCAARPVCVLSGGEPTVSLTPTSRPRKGGRNQQLMLAALTELWEVGLPEIVLLSGGTDGEDGPTDAAGAILNHDLWSTARERGCDPHADLAIQNAYHYLDPLGGLIRTGPTHTNVMDLRVALIHPRS